MPGRPEPERSATRPNHGPAERGIRVDVTPRHVRLVPGEAATASITVRNMGAVVDEVTLIVSGATAAWAQVAPDRLNIFPGTEAQATIRFTPPRAPRPEAGLLELEIGVNSRMQPQSSTVFRGSLDLAAYDNLTATAEGTTYLSGATEGVLPIKVRNLGNRQTTAYVQASDLPGAGVLLSNPSLTLEPGAEATVWATIKSKTKLMAGTSQQHPFTVSVSSDYTPPITIDGRFEQTARARGGRRWLIFALLGTGLVAAAAAVVVFGPGLFRVPGSSPTPTSVAIATDPTSSSTTPTVLPPSEGPPSEGPPSEGPPSDVPPSDVPVTPTVTESPTPSVDPYLGWVDLGGELSQGAAATTWTTGVVQLVAPWSDETLYVNSTQGAGWRGWEKVPNPKTTSYKPAIVGWNDGRVILNIFIVGDDGQLYQQSYDDGFWSDWQSLGGNFDTGPAATSSGPGRIDVFARSADDGTLQHNWFDGTSWNFWETWTTDTLRAVAPAAVSWTDGGEFPVLHIAVFAVHDADQAMYLAAYDSTVGLPGLLWQPLSGDVASAPAVTSWGPPNQFDVFARGPAPARNLLQNQTVDGVNWTGWTSLADFELASGPAATSWGPGRIDVFVVGLDNRLHHRWNDNGIWQP